MRLLLGSLAIILAALACSEDKDAASQPGAAGGDDTSSGGDDTSSVATDDERDGTAEGACVYRINEYRKTIGLARLVREKDKEACAAEEAKSDSESGKAHGAFGQCSEMAQNECPGWPAPAADMIDGCLEMMWDEGPGGGHYDNMSGDFKTVACGFYVTPDSKVWAIQNFRP